MTGGRILVDARLPWGSGIGRYIRNLVPLVVRQMPQHHFTLLVASGDRKHADLIAANNQNARVRVSDIEPFSLREQFVFTKFARQYDLAWFTNYWVPIRWKGRFVATVHDLIHIETDFPASRFKRIVANLTFSKVKDDATEVIFVSRFSARVFKRKIGKPKSSIVIHHGIDHLSTAEHETLATREKFALIVSAAKEHKNLAMIIEAWQCACVPSWRLNIVTPADDLRSSIDLGWLAGQDSTIRIIRGISDGELDALYASAGFVLIPSRYEGFGLPLLEAMRSGAPVISSTADALVEIASGAQIAFVNSDDRCGWVDAIRALAAECGPTGERQSLISKRNKEIADSFTWHKTAIATVECLERALSKGFRCPQ